MLVTSALPKSVLLLMTTVTLSSQGLPLSKLAQLTELRKQKDQSLVALSDENH